MNHFALSANGANSANCANDVLILVILFLLLKTQSYIPLVTAKKYQNFLTKYLKD